MFDPLGKDKNLFVRLPVCDGTSAYAEKQTGIAWAMMVQAAIKYNNSGINSQGNFDISVFEITGPDSAFRSYHKQVEAELIDRKKDEQE